MDILISLLGMFTLIGIAVLASKNRRAIKLRTVAGAFAIQFFMGGFVLYSSWGQSVLETMSNGVTAVVDYGNSGLGFLFGAFVNHDKMTEVFGGNFAFIFALRVLPMIVFFSSLIAVLYYLGIMQWIIKIIGGALSKALGTSKGESLSAAANIFVGETEAPLVVKPFISRMTESELFAIMTCGMASVAGSVLGGYAAMGVPMKYLIAASFMSAPGGLLFAKLLIPETNKTIDYDQDIEFSEGEEKPTNVIDAAAVGATTGMHIALTVGAMLLAFVSLVALMNGVLGGVGGLIHVDDLSLDKIFGWVLSPIAFIIGVPWSEAQPAGALLGQKMVINEFFAYINFMNPDMQALLSERSKGIISFALCGFANIGSIAILIGGLSIMAPTRRADVARLGLWTLLAGTLSNLMSATIAGLFLGLGA